MEYKLQYDYGLSDSGENIAIVTGVTVISGGYNNTLIIPAQVQEGKTYTVSRIEQKAFANAQLEETEIQNRAPALVIGEYAFQGAQFKRFTCDFGGSVSAIGVGAFYNSLIKDAVLIMSTSLKISENAFFNCSQLRTCRLLGENSSVKVSGIGRCAFSGCSSLSKMEGGELLNGEIGEKAFENSGIEEFAIGTGVTALGKEVFVNSKLKKIAYNNNHIGLSIHGTTSSLENVFENCTELNTIDIGPQTTILPRGFLWSSLSQALDISFSSSGDSGCQLIDEYAFMQCTINSILFVNSITEIGSKAFAYTKPSTEIGRMVLPQKLTTIDSRAFAYSEFTEIILPNTVSLIQERAFEGCNSLEQIILPSAIDIPLELGHRVFIKSGLKKITIPKNTVLGDALFNDSALEEATIQCEIQNCNRAFSNVENLQRLYINNWNPLPELRLLGYCPKLQQITINNIDINNKYTLASLFDDSYASGVNKQEFSDIYQTSIITGDKVLGFIPKTLSTIIISSPAGQVGSIPKYMFEKCDMLSTINLSNINRIGENAFSNCGELTIRMPNNIIYCEENAFDNTSGITYISDVNNWALSTFENRAASPLCGKTQLYLKDQPIANIRFSENLERVGDYAFCEVSGIDEIYLGKAIKTLGRQSFYKTGQRLILNSIELEDLEENNEVFYRDNTDQLSVTIGAAVHRVPKYFTSSCCKAIVSLKFSDRSVCKIIAERAFSNCLNLRNVSLPNTLESIGDYAFSSTPISNTFEIPEKIVLIGKGAFQFTKIPELIIAAKQLADFGENYYVFDSAPIQKITFKKQVTKVPAYMFSYTSIPILSTIVFEEESECDYIGEEAFLHCEKVAAITIPPKVLSLGRKAFYGVGLTTINYNAVSLANLSSNSQVFYHDTIQTDINIGKEVKKIPNYLFANTRKGQVSFAAKSVCSSIGDFAFSGYTHMITLPNSLKEIGKYAFAFTECQAVDLPIGITELKEGVFYGCPFLQLSKNTLAKIKKIGDFAFANCSLLTTVYVSDDIERLSKTAFDNTPVQYHTINGNRYLDGQTKECVVLYEGDTVGIHENVRVICEEAFYQHMLYDQDTVIIPEHVIFIGPKAFGGCLSLKNVVFKCELNYSAPTIFADCYGITFTYEKSIYPDDGYPYGSYKAFTLSRSSVLCDYIGFSFDGLHSYADMRAFRVSDGNNYELMNHPSLEEITSETENRDGMYYFGTKIKEKKIPLKIVFDNMTEAGLRKWRKLCANQNLGDLILDEEPYKVYTAKVTGTPSLKAIPFEKNGSRVYKGEGMIEFICYWPYAHTPDENTKVSTAFVSTGKFSRDGRNLNSYFYDNVGQWSAASGLGEHVDGDNVGDLPAPFIFKAPESIVNCTQPQIQLVVGNISITIPAIPTTEENPTSYSYYNNIEWDSGNGVVSALIDNVRSPIHYTGNSLGAIPVGGVNDWGLKIGDNIDNSNCELNYHYWYY